MNNHCDPAGQVPDAAGVSRRISVGDASWLDYEPCFLSRSEVQSMGTALSEEVPWEQREIVLFGKPVLQPRLIGWCGDLPYRYSAQTLPPRSYTPMVAALLARVQRRVELPFNHVLLNLYRDGKDSMGFHADDEPELGPTPQVASLSLGATRRFVVKTKRGRVVTSLSLASGSLLLMAGKFQAEFAHGVPKQRAIAEARINLTFRYLLRTP